jgi:CheY-like chemotaxis protein
VKVSEELVMSEQQLIIAAQSVLVVDDDPFSQNLLRELLVSMGVSNVRIASSGIEGLRELSRLPRMPDFLICDLFMPDMDGFEFLNKLGQQNYPGCVILVSGGNAEMLNIAKEVALADGINLKGVFSKPLHGYTLAQAMGTATVRKTCK